MKYLSHILISFALVAQAPSAYAARPKTIYLDKMDKTLDSRWNALDNVCRGEPGGSPASDSACAERFALDRLIIKKGCTNIYPAMHSHDTSYWKCRR